MMALALTVGGLGCANDTALRTDAANGDSITSAWCATVHQTDTAVRAAEGNSDEAFRQRMEALLDGFTAMATAPPSDIAPEVDIVTTYGIELIGALKAADFDPAATVVPVADSDAALAAADTKLRSYVLDICGLELTTIG